MKVITLVGADARRAVSNQKCDSTVVVTVRSTRRLDLEAARIFLCRNVLHTAGDGIRTHDVQLGNDELPCLKRVNNATHYGCVLQVMREFAAC